MANTKSVAIITGGSRGIGRATAIRLARDFSAIVLVARDEHNLETTASEVRSLGAQSFFEKWAPAHNLTVEEAIKKFPEQAGITRLGKPEEIADLMAYLVSPAAKWMTGSSVRMDGGEIKGI